jgi:hypothetical protein
MGARSDVVARMLQIGIVLLVIGCGGSRPRQQEKPLWQQSCDEKCARESEWFAGCMMACRDHAQAFALHGDGGLIFLTTQRD